MDRNEEILLGTRRRKVWWGLLLSIPVVAALAGVAWFVVDKRNTARDKVLIENVTSASFACVASVRGDAPEVWGLERALEHMSRMERVTRESENPTAEERRRFHQLATDAARGCEELGRLMLEAQREAPHLYFAVPAPLAVMPDLDHPDRWYRRVLPRNRPDVLELTNQIRTMSGAIDALRTEHALMAQELPIDGRGPSELARIVTLAPLPRDRESITGQLWPFADGVITVRRGAIGRVPCETRYLNRASCFNEFVQRVSWDGEVSEMTVLTRPARVDFWAAFTTTPDGALYAVGVDREGDGIVGRYPLDGTEPALANIDAAVDGATNIAGVAGGVAVFPDDGSAWLSQSWLSFEQVDTTTPPVLVTASQGADRGIDLEGYGHFSLFGSEEAGWTSRLTPPDGEDVLLRILDAHSRVSAIAQLRSLRSGKVAALLVRGDTPSALIVSTDFGRTWLAEE